MGGFALKGILWRYLAAGAAAGLCNGFFGGGGGSVLVPALTGVCGLEQRRAFAHLGSSHFTPVRADRREFIFGGAA